MRTRSRMVSETGPGIGTDRRIGTAELRTRADVPAGADAYPGPAVPHPAAAGTRTRPAAPPSSHTLRRTTAGDQAPDRVKPLRTRTGLSWTALPRIRFAPLTDTRSGALWPGVPPEQTPRHLLAPAPGHAAAPVRTTGVLGEDRSRPGRADGRSVARGIHARRTRTWN